MRLVVSWFPGEDVAHFPPTPQKSVVGIFSLGGEGSQRVPETGHMTQWAVEANDCTPDDEIIEQSPLVWFT